MAENFNLRSKKTKYIFLNEPRNQKYINNCTTPPKLKTTFCTQNAIIFKALCLIHFCSFLFFFGSAGAPCMSCQLISANATTTKSVNERRKRFDYEVFGSKLYIALLLMILVCVCWP